MSPTEKDRAMSDVVEAILRTARDVRAIKRCKYTSGTPFETAHPYPHKALTQE
jgi:hypothetical protein